MPYLTATQNTNSMLSTITGVLLIFMAIILSRPVTTFVHEMGHAIPSLMFTNGPVIIHIGSYGDISNSTTTTIGRLTIIFKFKLTDLQLGLCQHQGVASIWQNLLIILGGPIFSLLLGLFFFWILPAFKESQFIAFFIGIFLTSGIWDFFVNIIPEKEPMKLHDGGVAHNDGSQFLSVLKSRNYPEVYFEGIQLLNEEKNMEAANKLKEAIEQGVHDLQLYQLVMTIYSTEKQKRAAMDFHTDYSGHFKLSTFDYTNIGELFEEDGFYMKAVAQYNKAIQLDFKNVQALALRGKLLLEMGHHERGKADLHKVELMEGRASVRKF